MGEILTKTMIESEEAHFSENRAPKLRLIQNQDQCVDLAVFELWLKSSVDQLLYKKACFENAKISFDSSFGYVAVKCMIENLAEFILHRKQHNKRLRPDEIYRLRIAICRNETLKAYWEGANLGLILEQDDALSDRELYYLMKHDNNSDHSSKARSSNPLNSYQEIKLEQLFDEIEKSYEKNLDERKALKDSIGLISMMVIIPILWLVRL